MTWTCNVKTFQSAKCIAVQKLSVEAINYNYERILCCIGKLFGKAFLKKLVVAL